MMIKSMLLLCCLAALASARGYCTDAVLIKNSGVSFPPGFNGTFPEGFNTTFPDDIYTWPSDEACKFDGSAMNTCLRSEFETRELDLLDYYFPSLTSRPCSTRDRVQCVGGSAVGDEFFSCGCVWCGSSSSLAPLLGLLVACVFLVAAF